MRRRSLGKAKLVVAVRGNKYTGIIRTISVFDNRTQQYLPREYICERGIVWFLNMDDMKETLNWNLNGNSSKFQLKWGQTAKGSSEGLAFVFD